LNITPITDRLFIIENFIPDELANKLVDFNWYDVPWQRGLQQEDWPRRQLKFHDTLELVDVSRYIFNNMQQVGDIIGVEYSYPETNWWVDEPGFDVSIHTDGELKATMQLYWGGVGEEYGTVFFNSKRNFDVLHSVPFRFNSGYLMLNELNEDGSQPLLWHGMLNKVPENAFRASSYTHLMGYKTK
jgi:hypothetical protein